VIFVTVGSVMPFDRLLAAADELASTSDERWFAQTGVSTYRPCHMATEAFLDKESFEARIRDADAVVGHAGIGTISAALAAGTPLLVMPRDPGRGEHVDDHQLLTAELFAACGHLLVAMEVEDLAPAFAALDTFEPVPRSSSAVAVADRVGRFLEAEISRRSSDR
jgi:UDP-N-acetylglucosamine transferase subunit ALG13